MSKLSPRATKALSELEALAKSIAAERAAQPAPKPSPADHIMSRGCLRQRRTPRFTGLRLTSTRLNRGASCTR
jgi:hypothetical protein